MNKQVPMNEKYRALKRKFRVLRDEYVKMLELYETARNKVKILTNEKIFLQGKVDTILKVQKAEEDIKRQFVQNIQNTASSVSPQGYQPVKLRPTDISTMLLKRDPMLGI